MIELLLKYNADINLENRDLDTPLTRASASGNLNIIEYLVKNGAKVNHTKEKV